MRKGLLGCAVIALVVAGCQDQPTTSEPTPAPPAALHQAPGAELVPNRYIVVFKDQVTDVAGEARREIAAHGGQHLYTYEHALKGYAANLPSAAVAALRNDTNIAFIEQDQRVRLIEPAGTSINAVQSPVPSWGLDRIDQRNLPLNSTYSYKNDGTGVHFYGIDSGIRSTHNQFAGRFSAVGHTAILDGLGTEDCAGHGTHTAATVGGSTVGVAKGVIIHAVRVLDCDGASSSALVIDGVDWVAGNAQRPAVANMSIRFVGGSAAVDLSVKNSIAAGITYVVSAGNNATDACSQSPARLPEAITVAASDSFDQQASFSNFGTCVDLFAPGHQITSAWFTGDNVGAILSGTSMAAPHVAGAAALYLQLHPTASPAAVAKAITGKATSNAISNPGTGTPNRLLFTGFIATNTWSNAPALLPSARGAIATGQVGGLLYVIGGNTGTATTAMVQAYDPATNNWITKTSLPAPREYGNGTGVINGLLYLAGGWASPTANAPKPTLYAYNPGTNAWSTRPAMPTVSGCGATGVIGGKLYVLTGCVGSSVADIRGLLHEFDPGPRAWAPKASAPHEHAYPVAGVINGKFYVAGGVDATGTVTGIVDVYDPGNNSWTTAASMPTPRYAAASGVVGTKLYAVGGVDASNNLLPGTVESYTPATNSWSSRAKLPTPRYYSAGGVVNGLLYAVGGFTLAGASRKVEAFWP